MALDVLQIVSILLAMFGVTVVAIFSRSISISGMAVMLNIAIAAICQQQEIVIFSIVFSFFIVLVDYYRVR